MFGGLRSGLAKERRVRKRTVGKGRLGDNTKTPGTKTKTRDGSRNSFARKTTASEHSTQKSISFLQAFKNMSLLDVGSSRRCLGACGTRRGRVFPFWTFFSWIVEAFATKSIPLVPVWIPNSVVRFKFKIDFVMHKCHLPVESSSIRNWPTCVRALLWHPSYLIYHLISLLSRSLLLLSRSPWSFSSSEWVV